MPILAYIAIGALGGFWLSNGVENVSSAVRWTAIGGAGYLAAKHFKVI